MTQIRAPVLLLDAEAASESGRNHIISNIESTKTLFDILKTTLGPMGRDKMICESPTKFQVSNDGAFILSSLPIKHPIPSIIRQVSLAQDQVSGDGTTSACLLICSLLNKLKRLIEKNMDINIIIESLIEIETFLIKEIDNISVTMEDALKQSGFDSRLDTSKSENEKNIMKLNKMQVKREIAILCAKTSLNSKLVSSDSLFFSNLIVDSLLSTSLSTKTTSNLNNSLNKQTKQNLIQTDALKKIRFLLVPGSSSQSSFHFPGVAFKKTFSYAGFEAQPKLLRNIYVACLDLELELHSEKETAEIRLSSPEEYQKVVDAEFALFKKKLDGLIQMAEWEHCALSNTNEVGSIPDQSKVKLGVVISTKPIGDLATQYFSTKGIFCAGRVKREDLEAVAEITGAKVIRSVDLLSSSSPRNIENIKKGGELGFCELFEEKTLSSKRFNFFYSSQNLSQSKNQNNETISKILIKTDTQRDKISTIVLRGGSTKYLEETKRSLQDALKTAHLILSPNPSKTIKERKILFGAGATEIALSRALKSYYKTYKEDENEIETFNKNFNENENEIENEREIESSKKIVYEAFSEALETLPEVLASNAGFDGIEIVGRIKKKQKEEGIKGKFFGVDLSDGKVKNCVEEIGVLEPMESKVSLVKAVVEGTCLVLGIDETVRDRPTQKVD